MYFIKWDNLGKNFQNVYAASRYFGLLLIKRFQKGISSGNPIFIDLNLKLKTK